MIRAVIPALLLCAPVFAREIAPADLAGAMLGAQVVVLGEVHDNPAHHAHQAQAVAALRPAALVFEMLTPEQAARATPDLRDDAAALAAALEWERSGWPDFAMYHPIFAAARGARVYGAALPRDAVRRSVAEGAAAVFGPDAPRFGLDRPLPAPEQALREAEQMEAHCRAMPEDLMPGMVEAQRLRDAALAEAALQALADTGGPVAVIAGSGHARSDWGVPALIRLAEPGITVLSVGQVEAPAAPDQPFDRWIVTPPAERDDPCAALR
ncbi:ChaN family lipoprotein [Frigidibacter oleivorans]|uniref:ChaN family lipoprotein n=1 Tax=Frigidibacter oleivorans TaxID=2487129 RepID=UPI000F8CDD19|nr:ChaN family lipoprotein [Frigidibacter oleivorans]